MTTAGLESTDLCTWAVKSPPRAGSSTWVRRQSVEPTVWSRHRDQPTLTRSSSRSLAVNIEQRLAKMDDSVATTSTSEYTPIQPITAVALNHLARRCSRHRWRHAKAAPYRVGDVVKGWGGAGATTSPAPVLNGTATEQDRIRWRRRDHPVGRRLA